MTGERPPIASKTRLMPVLATVRETPNCCSVLASNGPNEPKQKPIPQFCATKQRAKVRVGRGSRTPGVASAGEIAAIDREHMSKREGRER